VRIEIEEALKESSGRVSGPQGAAVRLGVPASTLESRIRALSINKFQFRDVRSLSWLPRDAQQKRR